MSHDKLISEHRLTINAGDDPLQAPIQDPERVMVYRKQRRVSPNQSYTGHSTS